jgi:multisubunit Na+/H+ antiporter MnhF subunit
MSVHNKIPARHVVQVLVVLALLVVIVNPELRVLVLFADSFGLELVFLLLTLQLRSISSLFVPFAQTLGALSCSAASYVGSLALRAYQNAVVFGRLDRLICPLLIVMSYGLRCRVAIRAA